MRAIAIKFFPTESCLGAPKAVCWGACSTASLLSRLLRIWDQIRRVPWEWLLAQLSRVAWAKVQPPSYMWTIRCSLTRWGWLMQMVVSTWLQILPILTNVSISAKKLEISNSIKFAGHTVSDQGIKPDPSLTDAIKHFSRPNNLTSYVPLWAWQINLPSYQIWPRTLIKLENCFLPKTQSYGCLNMNKSS